MNGDMGKFILVIFVCSLYLVPVHAQNVGYMGKKLLLGTHVEVAPYAMQRIFGRSEQSPCTYKGKEPGNEFLFFYTSFGTDLEYTVRVNGVLAADLTVSRFGVISKSDVQDALGLLSTDVDYVNANVTSFTLKYLWYGSGFIAPLGSYSGYGLSYNKAKVNAMGSLNNAINADFSTVSVALIFGYRKVFFDQVLIDLGGTIAYPISRSASDLYNAASIYTMNRLFNARLGVYYML